MLKHLAEQIVYYYDDKGNKRPRYDEDDCNTEQLVISIEQALLEAQGQMCKKIKPGIYRTVANQYFRLLGLGYEIHQGHNFMMVVTRWFNTDEYMTIYKQEEFIQIMDRGGFQFVGPG
jgi:hypothetical protein